MFWPILPDIGRELVALPNLSLATGTVPAVFKSASVTPLLKKAGADPEDLKNYRPVLLLRFPAKNLERHVTKILTRFLEE